MTKFSVIIPTLSGRKILLHRAIESVLHQTLPPVEIVVVGADYLPALDIYGESDNRVALKAIRDSRKLSASESRNLGAKITSSLWLAFLDDDDFWDSNYLQRICEKICEGYADAIVATLHQKNLQGESKKISRQFVGQDLFLTNPGVTGSNITVRKEVFEALGGFSTKLTVSQDKALILELLKRNHKLAFAERAIAFNCEHTLPRLTDPKSQLRGYSEFFRVYRKEMPIITQIQFLRKMISYWRVNVRVIGKFRIKKNTAIFLSL